MERQIIENNSSTSGAANLNVGNMDHPHDREKSNKVLPFSIEAILNAPHPKREMPVLRNRAHSSLQENRADWTSPLSTLEDFTSSNLPDEEIEDTPENPEIGELKTLLLFNSIQHPKARKPLAGSNSA